jgi:hypothetical protein
MPRAVKLIWISFIANEDLCCASATLIESRAQSRFAAALKMHAIASGLC